MSILLKAVNSSDTTLMISTDVSLPASDGVIKIGSEVIIYDELYMGTLYGCVRGARSTVAVSHLVGSLISLIDFYSAMPSGGVASASNLGSGEGIFSSLVADDLQFKSLTAGSGITLTPTVDSVDISLSSPIVALGGTELAPALLITDLTDGGGLYTYIDPFAIHSNGIGITAIPTGGGPQVIRAIVSTDGLTIIDEINGSQLDFWSGTNRNAAYLSRPAAGSLNLYNSQYYDGVSTVAINIIQQGANPINLTTELDAPINLLTNSHLNVQVDSSVTAGDTRLLLWDVDSGTLARVTVGIADSGGVGFKVLRIPN